MKKFSQPGETSVFLIENEDHVVKDIVNGLRGKDERIIVNTYCLKNNLTQLSIEFPSTIESKVREWITLILEKKSLDREIQIP
jgi:hypothetical protein